MDKEPQLPALSAEQRLSFSVNDVLGDLEFKYNPELDLEIRIEHLILDGERSIHVFQSRKSADDSRIQNIVQSMTLEDEGRLNRIASWYTGSTEFDIFTFRFTDDVKVVLQEFKQALRTSSEDDKA